MPKSPYFMNIAKEVASRSPVDSLAEMIRHITQSQWETETLVELFNRSHKSWAEANGYVLLDQLTSTTRIFYQGRELKEDEYQEYMEDWAGANGWVKPDPDQTLPKLEHKYVERISNFVGVVIDVGSYFAEVITEMLIPHDNGDGTASVWIKVRRKHESK